MVSDLHPQHILPTGSYVGSKEVLLNHGGQSPTENIHDFTNELPLLTLPMLIAEFLTLPIQPIFDSQNAVKTSVVAEK